jgi:hypothetical protein
MEESVSKSIYPPNIKDVLLKSLTNTYTIQDLINYKKDSRKKLIIYCDEVLNIQWIIDLKDFIHPFGIGPNISRFTTLSENLLDVTQEFNEGSHGNCEIEFLLLHSIGIICNTLKK